MTSEYFYIFLLYCDRHVKGAPGTSGTVAALGGGTVAALGGGKGGNDRRRSRSSSSLQ